MNSNLENAIEVISQALYELVPPEDPDNDEIRKCVSNLISLSREAYVLVHWPESQDFMEKEWFDEEAFLSDESSYFIPLKYLI